MAGTRRGMSWAAVVVNRDAAVCLDACLRALARCDEPPSDTVVVDDASSDDSLSELAGWPAVRAEVQPRTLGFGAGARRGLAATDAPLVAVLLPDLEVARDFGTRLAAGLEADRRVGALSPLVLDGRGVPVHAGGTLRRPLLEVRDRATQPGFVVGSSAVDVPVATAGLVTTRAALARIGGFDPRFRLATHALADLSVRLGAAGWTVRCDPGLTARSLGGLATENAGVPGLAHGDRLRFAVKHLAPSVWWREFVPAEFGRLREALRTGLTIDWVSRSGGAALEAEARRDDATMGSFDGEALHAAAAAVEAARAALPSHEPPDAPRIRRLGRHKAHGPLA